MSKWQSLSACATVSVVAASFTASTAEAQGSCDGCGYETETPCDQIEHGVCRYYAPDGYAGEIDALVVCDWDTRCACECGTGNPYGTNQPGSFEFYTYCENPGIPYEEWGCLEELPPTDAPELPPEENYYSGPPGCGGEGPAGGSTEETQTGDSGKDLSDPIGLANGDYQLAHTDLVLKGRGIDFMFQRTYRSKTGFWSTFYGDDQNHLDTGPFPEIPAQDIRVADQPLGVNWDHNWNVRILGPRRITEVERVRYGCQTDALGDPLGVAIGLMLGTGRYDLFVNCDARLNAQEEFDFEIFTTSGIDGDYRSRQHRSIIRISTGNPGASGPVAEFITGANTVYTFHPIDISPFAGMLTSVTDRNGNSMSVEYEAVDMSSAPTLQSPRIKRIVDTLGRPIDFTYHTSHPHLLKSIEDEDGRSVEYDYDKDVGDYQKDHLKTVSLPVIESTSAVPLEAQHANRFGASNRRKWQFEYWPDADTNTGVQEGASEYQSGQLRRATSPNGDVIVENWYEPVSSGREDRRVVRQRYGGNSYIYALTRSDNGNPLPSGDTSSDYSLWLSDRRGFVTKLDYTGRGAAGMTEHFLKKKSEYDQKASVSFDMDGYPSNQWWSVISGSPDRIEEYDFNEDWQNTRLDTATNDTIEHEYQDNAGPATKTTVTDYVTGETIVLDRSYIGPGNTGCACSNTFLDEVVDGVGNRTDFDHDVNYNVLAARRGQVPTAFGPEGRPSAWASALATEAYTYNSHGQIETTTHPFRILAGGSSAARVDRMDWGTTQSADSYGLMVKQVIDVGGEELETEYEYDAIGNTKKITNPDGDYVELIFNQANQLTIHRQYDATNNKLAETQFFYDANGNLVRQDVWNVVVNASSGVATVQGNNEWITTLHQYDSLDYRVRTAREIQGFNSAPGGTEVPLVSGASKAFNLAGLESAQSGGQYIWSVTDYRYDEHKNPVEVVYPMAVNGGDSFNRTVMVYDDRDQLLSMIEGANPASITRYDHDSDTSTPEIPNGNSGSITGLRVTAYVRDAKGRVIEIVVAPGDTKEQRTKHFYDGFDRLVAVQDPMGNRIFKEYDNNSNVIRTAACGALAKDTNSSFDSSENSLLSYVRMEHDALNRMVEERHAILSLAPSESKPCSATLNVTTGEVSWGSDPVVQGWQARVTGYNPDSSTRFTAIPAGLNPGVPDAGASLSSLIADQGISVMQVFYDTASREKQVIDAAGKTTEYEYNLDSTVFSVTHVDELNQEYNSLYAYDGLGREVLSVEGRYIVGSTLTGPNNFVINTYDSRNNIVEIQDSRGNTKQFEYDGLNRNFSTTIFMSADGAGGSTFDPYNNEIVTQIEYDVSSRVTRRVDDNGNVTAYLYDGLGREVLRRMADGTIHQVGSGLSSNAWSSLNSPPSLTSGFTSGYDTVGNVVTVTDANETVANRSYDKNNRHKSTNLSVALGSAVGGTTYEEFDHNGLGNIILAENDFAKIVRIYDSRGLILSEVVNYDGSNDFPVGSDRPAVVYTHDVAGNEIICEYPSQRAVYKSYDELNRLVTLHEDLGKTDLIASYQYAGNGRVSHRMLGNGTEATYEYSGYNGDPGGRSGLLPMAQAGLTDEGFMQIRRIHHFKSGAPGFTIEDREIWWDDAGNKLLNINADNSVLNRRQQYFDYDSADRLVRTEYLYPGATSQDGAVDYALDGVHNRVRRNQVDPTFPNYADPVTTTESIFERHWGPSFSPDNNAFFMESPGDRPVNQYTRSPDRQFTYDDNGNLTINHDPEPADIDGDYIVNADDRNAVLQAIIDCGGIDEYDQDWEYLGCGAYDVNGDGWLDQSDYQIVNDRMGFKSYNARLAYDYRNQLLSYDVYEGQDLVEEIEYEYDAFNRRIRRDVIAYSTGGGGQIGGVGGIGGAASVVAQHEYRYGGQAGWQLLEEWNVGLVQVGPPPVETFVYGNYIDEVVQKEARDNSYGIVDSGTDPDEYYYHQDDLYSVLAITDASGDIVERYRYSDYGEFSIEDDAGNPLSVSAIHTLHTFTGRIIDSKTGLLEYRHRWMSPTLGRFVERDPLQFIDGMNLYSYVLQNPISGNLDPSGLAIALSGVSRNSVSTGITATTSGIETQSLRVDVEIDADFRQNAFGNQTPNTASVFVGIFVQIAWTPNRSSGGGSSCQNGSKKPCDTYHFEQKVRINSKFWEPDGNPVPALLPGFGQYPAQPIIARRPSPIYMEDYPGTYSKIKSKFTLPSRHTFEAETRVVCLAPQSRRGDVLASLSWGFQFRKVWGTISFVGASSAEVDWWMFGFAK